MFDFFRKKSQPVQSELMPIPLPELPAEKNNPVAIESLLKDGNAVWGWYKVADFKNGQINISAMMNITYGFEGIALFRKEGHFLVKYRTDVVGKKLELHLKISEICKFTHSNVMELYNTELSDAYKVLLDEEQEFAAHCQAYIHDLTEESINDYLTNHRVMAVGEEHFFAKKDYPNGLPENLKRNRTWKN